MDSEKILDMAMKLESGRELILSYGSRAERNAAIKIFKTSQRLMVKNYELGDAEQIPIESEDSPDGKFLIKIMPSPKPLEIYIRNADGSMESLHLDESFSDGI